MGFLFSKEEKPVYQKPSITSRTHNIINSQKTSVYGTSTNIDRRFHQLRATPSNAIISQGTSKYNYPNLNSHNVSGQTSYRHLLKSVESNLGRLVLKLATEWDIIDWDIDVQLIKLLPGTDEFEEIRRLFKTTTQKHFKVTKIIRIQNPYLFGFYILKKAEMKSRYGYVYETYLFHGTKVANKDQICKENFDWRRHGHSVGNIFGKGTSFTTISCYASHYSDKYSSERLMFVSKVLIATKTVGNKYMELPPVYDYMKNLRYDTAIKPNGQVLVKFCDNEFYPTYIVYYTGHYQKPLKNQDTYYELNL